MRYCILFFIAALLCKNTFAQDTTIIWENQKITLPEVMVRTDLDYARILKRIQNDTTFYKAFRSLHIIEFSSYNDIRILDKVDKVKASWNSKTIQHRSDGCRTTEIADQKTT